MNPAPDSSDYYRHHGMMTDPGEEAALYADLPPGVGDLRGVVQGLLVHALWAQRYGLAVDESREQELQLRSVEDKLRKVRMLDSGPLKIPRPPERRLLGNCRDFSLMLCSMLRHQGVPARARCGFATYFQPDHFEDHWVSEYWRDGSGWRMVDAQLDALQRKSLGIKFDPLDVPSDQFLVGGKAWRLCRAGKADPDKFGINELHGLWFVRGNLIRDLASLNKVELLPWDSWGLIEGKDEDLSHSDTALLDEVADLTQQGDGGFRNVRSVYESSATLRVPPVIKSYSKTGVKMVEIGRL